MNFEIIPQEPAWIKQAKKNLTALYENQPLDRTPFEFRSFDIRDDFKPKADRPAQPVASPDRAEVRRQFFDASLRLKVQLAAIGKYVRQGFWDDTVWALHPIASAVGWLPEVFGCETEWFANRAPYPHPAINTTSQIDRLRPRFEKSDLYQAAIQQMRFFRKTVGERIPVAAPDLQCPISVASMIFDYNQLIYAMIDEPQRVHALLRMITDATIQACHAFKQEMTDYPLSHFDWWFPRGIILSDDLQAVLNPQLYREFAVPYNEIIAGEFGGLVTYSSGLSLHNIANVLAIKGLLAFNTPDPLDKLAAIVKNRTAVIVGGITEIVAPSEPGSKRRLLKTPESVEEFWWEDFGRLAEIKGQRLLYLCHALLCKHTPQEAYERMLLISQTTAHRPSSP